MPSWKLTEQQRQDAVAAYLAGEQPAEIERRYGLATGSVYALVCTRYGGAGAIIARIARLDDPGDVRLVMQAAQDRLADWGADR